MSLDEPTYDGPITPFAHFGDSFAGEIVVLQVIGDYVLYAETNSPHVVHAKTEAGFRKSVYRQKGKA